MGVEANTDKPHSHHAIPKDIPEDDSLRNKAAPGISYFTPQQSPPAGTALGMLDGSSKIPKLFTPLKLRGLELQNRIALSPLCQYSAQDGHQTDWHIAHLGGIIQRGPGLTFIEATAVQAEGRITPEDSGLWKDSQMEPLRKIVEFAHSQNQKIGIQLAHAGRKASTVAPWLSKGDIATKEMNGWPDNVYAPSAIAFNDHHCTPKEMTKEDIENFKTAFKQAIERSLKIGFDTIEIHNAHGYLLHSFLSPASNHRTDEYGGSFENRIRLTLEVVDLARKTIPDDMPLVLRISATDWLEEAGIEGWTLDQTVKLAEILADRGVDLLDVSSGGLHEKQHIHGGPGYQVPFSKAVKDKVGDKLHVGTVGSITEGKQANGYLEDDNLDVAFIGRMFQKNPGLVWTFADDLGVEGRWANQIRWGFGGRGKK
ncbi:FMN-linked oxidoreductase [Cucurbitaria berberidis CBS 394.84]|uniref:FMN-linked oxidoreductase n=1 Tax=Cucurbitaria berberidis CBS 394.84 TaxID=1168544 RepID=A0A9P4GRY9_9PLEO|nr:FMN-linked oxidoreductase [Cucurbitaria berberidis CBS 394.84]KAF1850242.1 FMN-linked oxidoreductase [Cucurbitaria berberidis CBS 394.84]